MLRWKPDMARHGTRQFLLFDYSSHWIDITGYWLRPDPVVAVQAMDYDTVRHRDGSVQQSMWISMETESGANAVIRGAAAGVSYAGHQFRIQGDAGTLRGRVDSTDGEHLEWDDGGCRRPMALQGEWFPDGFLASMRELLEAVHSGRPPVHSLSDNLRTVALVAAVCASAQAGGSTRTRWRDRRPMAERPFVTVFTMAFNQRAKVLRLACDLARQRYPADRFELVVLDDGGTDGTSDSLHGVAPELPYDLKVLRREREGDYLSGKRWNECIAASAPTHQVLIQVDDVRVRPDFVDRHIRWQGGGQLTRALVAALWREPFERPFDERMTGWASTRSSSPTAPSEPGPYRVRPGRRGVPPPPHAT